MGHTVKLQIERVMRWQDNHELWNELWTIGRMNASHYEAPEAAFFALMERHPDALGFESVEIIPATVTFVPCSQALGEPRTAVQEWPKMAQAIARLRAPSEVGVGDTLARLFARVGGERFKTLAKRLGIDCGCDNRQALLNAAYPYPEGGFDGSLRGQ